MNVINIEREKMNEAIEKELEGYATLEKSELCTSLALKNRLNKRLKEQVAEREAVIDEIAEYLGLQDKGLIFYCGLSGRKNPLLDEIKDYLSKSGDKVKLKKRIAELENENHILKKLFTN